jgi:hypothetical protein
MTRDELALNVSKAGTYGGSFGGLLSWLSANSDAITAIVAVCSLMIAMASFLLRIWLELREERRKQIIFEQAQKGKE